VTELAYHSISNILLSISMKLYTIHPLYKKFKLIRYDQHIRTCVGNEDKRF